MRLQNIIDSIRPAVMSKIEAVIAKHEKAISDKEADITDRQITICYTEGDLLLKLESPLRLIEPSGLCEAAKIMSEERRNYSDNSLQELQRIQNTSLSGLMGDNRRQAAMQNMGMNGPTGGAFRSTFGGCLHDW